MEMQCIFLEGQSAAANAAPSVTGANLHELPDETHEGPRKFADIHDFLDGDTSDMKYQPFHRVSSLKQGWIIYIRAAVRTNQLHQRVMPILRCMITSLTQFCQHDQEPQRPEKHWGVDEDLQDASPRSSGDRVLNESAVEEPRVLIKLLQTPDWKLKEGVTINLNEPWNVEFDKNDIAILGHVPPLDF
jgi:hypothetical protein